MTLLLSHTSGTLNQVCACQAAASAWAILSRRLQRLPACSPWMLSTAGVCRELAETILDSGDTLLTILGDILDFSKIDHNRYAAFTRSVPSMRTAWQKDEVVTHCHLRDLKGGKRVP